MDATQQIRQALSGLRFLADLSDEDQQKLAEISQLAEFTAGTEIFTEGSRASELYLLLGGRVELCMTVPAHGCLPILTLEEGDLLGWSAALGQGEMSATAVALKDTRVIVLSAEKLQDLCRKDHDIGFEITRRIALAISRRLVATRLQLLDLFADAPSLPPLLGRESPP